MLPPIFSANSWDDFTFEHYQQPACALLPQSFSMYAIWIKLDEASNVEIRCGKKRRRRKLTRGDVSIAPYRFEVDGGYLEECDLLQLCLKPQVIDRAAKALGLGNQVELVPVLGVVDPLVEQTVYQLEEELTANHGRSDYVKVLIDTLAAHLVRYYAKSVWTKSSLGGFPKYILDRVLDYIDNNRDRDLSVKEVAQAAGVEPDRFARAFKVATGKSFHSYFNTRRKLTQD